jgi:CRISPR-associated endonuclease/helicase Cas3
MTPLAHSARGNIPAQTYREHISGVIEKVKKNLAAMVPYLAEERLERYKEILYPAAEAHDLGKLALENQDVLSGKERAKRLPIEHRDAGVKYLLKDKLECPKATLVYSHHRPGLPDMPDEKSADDPFRFPTAMDDTEQHLSDYLRIHAKEMHSPLKAADKKAVRLSALEYRMLLSCLVDADYSDTAGESLTGAQPRWEERIQQLDRYIQDLQNRTDQNDERNRLRTLLYQTCRNAKTNAAVEYCDSPVGTGKTTAVMAHMLQMAQSHHLRHIFIVLPYTSIISQTVKVLRKAVVLDGENSEEIVAEHHHQADFEDIEHRRLATTWTAPIIVTTAVQFFETLASNLPAKLRKLHQLPGSGILFDEYHAALPVNLMLPAWKWITKLVDQWSCFICMCSATTVKFWEHSAFQNQSPCQAEPLLPPRVFKNLNNFEQSRIDMRAWHNDVPHFHGAAELAAYLNHYHGPKIVVLDTVQSAAYFANYLCQHGYDVLHLSTALTPEDRERTIAEVQMRLCPKSNCLKEWTLVATSCVECGLDFSFHYGFCQLRSLQSYVQLGGRIRRNCEKDYEDAALVAFTVTEDNFNCNPIFQDSKSVLKKMISSEEFYDLSVTEAVTEAFRQECMMSGKLSEEICKADRQLKFKTVAQKFRIINEKTTTVVANPMLAEKLQSGKRVSTQELQRGSVNIRKSVLDRLGLPDVELPTLSDTQYDAFLGYMKSLV